MLGPGRRWAVVAVAVAGVGLIAAPFAFGMFSKAPKGAVMIAGFKPNMTTARPNGYQRELAEINVGVRQTDTGAAAYIDDAGDDPGGFDAAHPGFASFDQQWPAIDSTMTGLMIEVVYGASPASSPRSGRRHDVKHGRARVGLPAPVEKSSYGLAPKGATS